MEIILSFEFVCFYKNMKGKYAKIICELISYVFFCNINKRYEVIATEAAAVAAAIRFQYLFSIYCIRFNASVSCKQKERKNERKK